ncbi:hypothetical protein [Nannocystis pusilla]|uniref:hypothetical protein n=1 Tax=Nannocystis pusilla TaxID=889268 RepID=UPI003B80FE73
MLARDVHPRPGERWAKQQSDQLRSDPKGWAKAQGERLKQMVDVAPFSDTALERELNPCASARPA